MEKSSLKSAALLLILLIAASGMIMRSVEARKVVSFRCNKTEDCSRIFKICKVYECINKVCNCLEDTPPSARSIADAFGIRH